MGKITNEMVEKSYNIGKDFFNKKITLIKGKELLAKIGMNEATASFYIEAY